MQSIWHNLTQTPFLLLSLALSMACSAAHGGEGDGGLDGATDTAPPVVCFAQDEFGCCERVSTGGPDCEAAGLVDESACRVTGCEACTGTCMRPLEGVDGCCDRGSIREVGNAAAGCACPEGTVPAGECGEVFPMCGCDPAFDPATRGIGVATPAPAFSDAATFVEYCRIDLGDSCCGAQTEPNNICGCLQGTIQESSCSDFTHLECFEDLGAGCCGAQVGACGLTECPSGSVPRVMCGTFTGGDAPPAGPCYVDLGGGCCGETVEPDGCGMCPEDTISTCSDACV